MTEKPFGSKEVAAVFAAYPPPLRKKLMGLRAMIFATAKAQGVGRVEETLKWGQPSYLTPETKSGVTVRIDKDDAYGGDYALYVSCNSRLVDEWRALYPELVYGGNRSVHFRSGETLPKEALRHCIAMALTHHRRKKSAGAR